MKVYKDYFKQILTGLMHILIEHSDLLRCHTWDFGVFMQVRSIMKHNELDAWKNDYILPNFKLQFSHNIFPRMSVCQNSDEIKATDPNNIRMSFFFVCFCFYFCFCFCFCFVFF